MPVLASSYRPPLFSIKNRHWQTIIPSFFRREGLPSNITREEFHTPDGGKIFLDWARVNSKKLLILSHGLCGSSRRHYILTLVKAFNREGWDCLAWNFRGTGASPVNNFKYTTQNSTYELDWITHYALETGHYEKVAYSGYSMGGNLSALYLSREAGTLSPQVCGGAVFCATVDILESNRYLHSFMGLRYTDHFLRPLIAQIKLNAAQNPGVVNLDGLEKIHTFDEFDRRFTAPLNGFKDEIDYYVTASAYRHFPKLKVPLLLVAPKNDPFLAGECFPVEEAKRNPLLYLEMPRYGGHCGFPTPRGRDWWPAQRALSFLEQYC